MNTTDMKRIETHLKKTFNNGGISVKPRPKVTDSAEVYVGDEFIGVNRKAQTSIRVGSKPKPCKKPSSRTQAVALGYARATA